MKGPGNALALIITSFLIIVSITGSGCISASLEEVSGYMELMNKDPVEAYRPDINELTVPLPSAHVPVSNEKVPEPNSQINPGFEISSRFQHNSFYQNSTGVVRISVINQGEREIFVYGYAVQVDRTKQTIEGKTGVTIRPGEEEDIGIIGFEIPQEVEEISIEPGVSFLTRTKSGKWFDCKEQFFDEISFDVMPPLPEQQTEYSLNTPHVFEMVNQKVSPQDISVREIAAGAAKAYPGTYNIYQICALFDYTKENIQYVSDPRGGDYWAPPDETLRIGAGDCEDYATLLASLVEAIGGTSRIYLTDDHAFAAVYIGNDPQQTDAIAEAVRGFYGPVPVYYSTDEYGSWLMLDPTSSMYPGDLPGGTAPTETGWTHLSTKKVTAIDIIPD